jgi:hypothetical protein
MEKPSPIGIQRINKRLDPFHGLIDMADWEGRPVDHQEQAFRSRALAGYFIKCVSDISDAEATKSITDSYHDRGIDAIHWDPRSSRLFVVQSKWGEEIDWKSAGEFCDGVRKLTNQDWKSFANNPKISARTGELETALASVDKIILVTVCVGSNHRKNPAQGRVDELVREIDGGSDIGASMHWYQAELLAAIKSESDPPKINADLYLSDWGEVKEPYRAVYGRVQAQALVDLWKANPNLSHANIRKYFNRTDVNSAIAQTAQNEPEHFWYFNNGLTIICDSFKPGISGRLKREEGIFHFEGINLVNGAQTTGILSDHLDKLPQGERDKLWIQIRAIATKDCPDGFASKITQYTNLQNAVTFQDFVALDPVQSRIACDFAVEKRRYAFKWGDPDPIGATGCTLREATLALACADSDIWFAVQAKREIGILWQAASDRYKKLFNDNLSSTRLWNAVNIMREVDGTILALGNSGKYPKGGLVAAHLQRIVLHCVFRSDRLRGWDSGGNPQSFANIAGEVCHDVFQKVCTYIVDNHDKEYLASLSKNFEKCAIMAGKLVSGTIDPLLPWEDAKGHRRSRRERADADS